MKKFNRRPSRQQVLRSLAELAILWGKPPDLYPDKETAAGVGTEAAAGENEQHAKDTTTGAERKRPA